MAQRFWKGLLHGAVISVAGLAVLSLWAPIREETTKEKTVAPEPGLTAPDTQAVSVDETPVLPDESGQDVIQAEDNIPATQEAALPAESETLPKSETPDSIAAPSSPQAATVDVPVGSEFGRGDDVAPQMPAPMVSEMQSRQTDAPAVSAPTAEPAPVAITDPGAQPAADLPDTSLTQTEEPPRDETPAPDMPVIQEVPRAAEAPEMVGFDKPDTVPLIALDSARNDVEVIEVKKAPEQVGTPVEANEPDDTTNAPALPSPQLDLSTPPDLSDLRVLEE